MNKMNCPKCGYEWLPRVYETKRCPRCGKWLIRKPIAFKRTNTGDNKTEVHYEPFKDAA
jgi:ssDNA-binding Zn-finger/Zn-ribbon topoisomerase 1